MSIADKSSSSGAPELDPLLKDLNEKKQIFRRNIVSLAAELKDVRTRLASKEEVFGREIITRQACNFWISIKAIQLFIFFFSSRSYGRKMCGSSHLGMGLNY